MIKLCVVTSAVWDYMKSGGIQPTQLDDLDTVATALSAHDIADMHLATEAFPFDFDAALDLTPMGSVYVALCQDAKYQRLCDRVKIRLDTAVLNQSYEHTSVVPQYTLEFQGESLWVAVLQRQHPVVSDPAKQLLTQNRDFFDSLIVNVLHRMPFEAMAKTNLFGYYIASCEPAAAR